MPAIATRSARAELRRDAEAGAADILDTIIRAKPATAKGVYLKGVTLSTTMGPGIKLDAAAITAAHK